MKACVPANSVRESTELAGKSCEKQMPAEPTAWPTQKPALPRQEHQEEKTCYMGMAEWGLQQEHML